MAVSAPCRFLPVRWLAEARDALAGILIPAPCRLCEKLLTHSSRIPVCEGCLYGFPRLPEKICASCGIPLPDMVAVPGEHVQCAACRIGRYSFDSARRFALYGCRGTGSAASRPREGAPLYPSRHASLSAAAPPEPA